MKIMQEHENERTTTEINSGAFEDIQSIRDMQRCLIPPELRFPAAKNGYEDECKIIDHVKKEKLKYFIGRENELTVLESFALREISSVRIKLLADGLEVGKTALICKFIDMVDVSTEVSVFKGYIGSENYAVLPFFCGLSPYSSTVDNLMFSLYYSLWKYLSAWHGFEEKEEDFQGFYKTRESFTRLLKYASDKARVIIAVDSVDRLLPCVESDDLLWLCDLPLDNVRIILTCNDFEGSHAFRLKEMGAEVTELFWFAEKEITEYILSLSCGVNPELYHRLIPLILAKEHRNYPSARYPLYISSLVQLLTAKAFFERDKIKALAETMPPNEAMFTVMKKAVEDYNENPHIAICTNLDWMAELTSDDAIFVILYSIAWSRGGLRDNDLERIWSHVSWLGPWNRSYFNRICMAMGEHLFQDNEGQFSIINQRIKKFYTENSFSDDDNFDDPEELEYIKNAAVAAFAEDNSDFAQKELMYYCWRAKTPDLAGIAIAEALIGGACDYDRLDNYTLGLRDIAQSEYTKKTPDESFLSQIIKWAESEKEPTRLLVCGVVHNTIRLLRNSSNSSAAYRIYNLYIAFVMSKWENADKPGRLALSASQLGRQLFEELKKEGDFEQALNTIKIMLSMLEYAADTKHNEDPDVYEQIIEVLADTYCDARDLLQYSDLEKANVYNTHGMELYHVLLEHSGCEKALFESFICCQWAALAMISKGQYEQAEEAYTPVFIEIDKYYNDLTAADALKNNPGILWLSYKILIACVIKSSEHDVLPWLMEKNVEMTRQWHEMVINDASAERESIASVREKRQQALKQIMAFHRESGNKKEAAKYKTELLGL